MTYRTHSVYLLIRVLVLLIFLCVLAFAIIGERLYLGLGAGFLCIISFFNLHKFLVRRFTEIDDFFEAVKYHDFSRRFVEDLGPRDMRQLRKGFNEVNRVVREINAKKEVQYLYLQKILEMVDIGILAYNLETGNVLWTNDFIKDTLDLPSFKNIKFVEKRKPRLFEEVFDTYHPEATSVTITVKDEKLKVLISDTVFQIEGESFKLIVLQNIDDTINQTETEAWKKLLSVMTHEIMNSIAPISSLADTLENQVHAAAKDPENAQLDMEDLTEGINSIKKRSEGLMKFAKTYRSLNRVTQLNLEKVNVKELFHAIDYLMRPGLKGEDITLEFELTSEDLQIEIDSYLIEQVLINLILNAIDACRQLSSSGRVIVSAKKDLNHRPVIRVTDNGTGIPEEIRETIFVPFFTTKKTGSGIGLSLCKQIMMLHKGKIQVYSEEGKGTAISLLFN